MKTLTIFNDSKSKEVNKEQFEKIIDNMLGLEDDQVYVHAPWHPFMQNMYIIKSTLFESLYKMLHPGQEVEIIDEIIDYKINVRR